MCVSSSSPPPPPGLYVCHLGHGPVGHHAVRFDDAYGGAADHFGAHGFMLRADVVNVFKVWVVVEMTVWRIRMPPP